MENLRMSLYLGFTTMSVCEGNNSEVKRMAKIRWLLLFFSLAFSQSLAQDAQPLDDLDKLYLTFIVKPQPAGVAPAYHGEFLAVKFWYVNGSEVPDPNNPTTLYLKASYDPNLDYIQEQLFRVAFNGTPLFKYEIPQFNHIIYGAKRPADPFETWISWYAHLSETQFPKSFALDNFMGVHSRDFPLGFPTPFKLNIPDSFTIGGAQVNYGAEPIMATESPANYGNFNFYPSRIKEDIVSINGYGPVENPVIVNSFWPENAQRDVSGLWPVGTHQGLAGFSACNEKLVEFQGGKRFIFKACTITVKPVVMTVAQPQN
jgi:hypothetical protein